MVQAVAVQVAVLPPAAAMGPRPVRWRPFGAGLAVEAQTEGNPVTRRPGGQEGQIEEGAVPGDDDLGRSLGLSCGLKSLSRLAGLTPVEVDRSQIHLLDEAQVRSYVASDARLAREMVDRRMPLAYGAVDPPSDRAVVPGARPSSWPVPTITLD